MTEIEQRINDLVSNFINEITKLAKRAAFDTLQHALAPVGSAVVSDLRLPATGRRGRGRVAEARPKGAKRPPAEIAALKDRVAAHVKSNPGLRIEQINGQLGTSTAELTLPLKKLIDEGAIRTEGERRATRYFPGEGGGRKAGGAKRGRRRR